MNSYQKKYLKYKSKYLLAKNELEQEGGAFSLDVTEDIYPEDLKEKASVEGKRLLDAWLGNRKSNGIDNVLELFDTEGNKSNISATTFSDYYKWTMMPVIWYLHKFITAKTSKNTFKVTFGVDIRDEKMRNAIDTDPALRDAIHAALVNLGSRQFKKEIFDKMGEKDGFLYNSRENKPLLDKDCVDYICGDDSANPRTLAQKVHAMGEDSSQLPVEDEDVHIYFYKVDTAKYSPNDKQEGLWFIEAKGPWPRVTWLETSMMQAVYEAYLRYNLSKFKDNIHMSIVYQRWLYGALLRCAKSVAFTRLVQTRDPTKQMTPALFTGRRTGGYLFLLLQNLFFAHHFNQFTPDGPVIDSEGKTKCLGTSSIDSYFELQKLCLPCLRPVGTHAHELSMVISVLFPYFDNNKYELPLTQIIGHELYRTLSAYPRPIPSGAIMFPMLPDTLGTAAFMKAANWVKKDGQPFISLINSARQDSGKLPNFLILMTQWNYNLGKMASEIDNTETLLKATELGYATSGAGGFFGDSAKVWNPSQSSPSMAVKAVNVEYCVKEDEIKYYEGLEFPHITITKNKDKTGHVKGYPIKVGDPEDMDKPALAEGKLSLDKTLPAETIDKIKNWVSNRRVRAFSSVDNDDIKKDSLNIDKFINLIPSPENFKGIGKFTG